MNEKSVLHELIHMDWPLILVQLVQYGETIKKIPWSKETFEFFPYEVFERKDNSVYFYIDQKGVDWKMSQAGAFNRNEMKKKTIGLYSKIKDTILKEKALDKKEFEQFIEKIKEFWTWLDCMWWMIEYYDKNKLPLEEVISVRKETEYFIPGLAAVIRNSIRKLYPKKAEFANALMLNEVITGKFPDDKELRKRMESYVYTDGKLQHSIEQAKKDYNFEISEIQNKELKGQTAFPGKVSGEVKIIKKREDMKDFKKGQILVASTTTPDFLPAMKMASAIISEHGGAICHAAITSRELKIPCIVGVKGAIKLLKNGDVIEADANKGTIRIIK